MRIGAGPDINVDGLYEIRNGRMFSFSTGLTASVGDYSHLQLFNPAASGKTIVVRRARAGPSAADTVYTSIYNTALTTLTGVGLNMDNGGAVGVGEVRTQQDNAALGTPFGRFQTAVASSDPLADDWIIMLGASEGFLLRPSNSNIGLMASWEWIEY